MKRVKSKTGKVYTYSKTYKRSKGGTLIYKSGKLNQAKIDSMLDEIKSTGDMYDVNEFKLQLTRWEKRMKGVKRLTVQTMRSLIADGKIEKSIINFGYSVDELVDELNIKYNETMSREYILNPSNWTNSKLRLPSGTIVEFEYNYTGGVLYD